MLRKALVITLISTGAGWLAWFTTTPAAAGARGSLEEPPANANTVPSAAKPDDSSQPADDAKTDEHHESKSQHLEINAELQARLGMTFADVHESTQQPEVRALGVVEDNPASSFTVRSPAAGFLRATATGFPALGDQIADHAAVAAIQPRLTPLEQFALAGQVVDARSSVAEVESELAAAQSSFESKRTLNAAGKMVSDRQYEEAEARLKSVSARLAGARMKLELLLRQQSAVERGLDPLPITADQGGQIVDILAGPGEAVESGQPLLKLAQFDHLLARVELPLGTTWPESQAEARIMPIADDSQILPAKRLGRTTHAGTHTRGESWLLDFDAKDTTLRAGTPIVALLRLPGEPLNGTIIPASAVIRYGGLTWVFVRIGANEFERRSVELHSRTPDGWFVTQGLAANEVVVATGAQVLLSEQLKAQIEAEAEAAE